MAPFDRISMLMEYQSDFATGFLAMTSRLPVRDARGSEPVIIDYTLDVVLLIHVMQEPVGASLAPLRVNRKLDITERLRKENKIRAFLRSSRLSGSRDPYPSPPS